MWSSHTYLPGASGLFRPLLSTRPCLCFLGGAWSPHQMPHDGYCLLNQLTICGARTSLWHKCTGSISSTRKFWAFWLHLIKLIAGAWSGWGREERKKDILRLSAKMNHPSNPFLSNVLKCNMTWRNTNVMSTWESNHLSVNGRQLMAKEQIGNCWALWVLTTHIILGLLLVSWHENIHNQQCWIKPKRAGVWLTPRGSKPLRSAEPWMSYAVPGAASTHRLYDNKRVPEPLGTPAKVPLPIGADQSSGRCVRSLSHPSIRDSGVSLKSLDLAEKVSNENWKPSTQNWVPENSFPSD